MRVRVGDVRLFVDISGSGLRSDGWDWVHCPTIVLVHGGPGVDHLSFRQPGLPFSQLASLAQLVYVDLRGSGSSDSGDESSWNLGAWADDVAELVRVLGLDRPIILGESAGGFVALEVAARHRDLVGGLILENTSASWSLDRVVEAFRRIGGDRPASVAKAYWDHPANPDAFVAYMQECLPLYAPTWPTAAEPPAHDGPNRPYSERVPYNAELGSHFASGEMRTFDHSDTVRHFDKPLLVIAGERDPICPVEDSDAIVALAQAPTYLRVPDAGHTVAAGAPELFLDAVRSYLELLETTPAGPQAQPLGRRRENRS